MQFHAIQLQGNILSAELLTQIQNDPQGAGQAPKDFWLEPNAKVRDEIQRAWADVKDQYQIFNRRLEKLKPGDTGRKETIKYWMADFLDYLGYKLEPSAEIALNGKTYRISHGAANLDGLPVHIAGIRESLDKKPDGRSSMSPHALVQEYLNLTEHVYGLVTNGAQLRLLRDSSRLTRLSYLEFDLTKILEEDRYADFALLYRLLHASRMPRTATDAPGSLIERYHTDSLAAGSRIREKLAGSVEYAILTFANGFLKHPDNGALRAALASKQISPNQYYDELLRLIYRLLFLMVTEERNLIYPEPEAGQVLEPQDTARRQIYYRYYAVQRLRLLAEKRLYDQQRYSDLWDGLLQTFRLFQAGDHGKALGIAPLAGDLFSSHALTHLGQCRLDNESLLRALFHLSAFENEQRQIIRVNYAGLDVEEFGSVYEGLLEYQPAVHTQPWEFRFEKGTERSSSGSHYTPDELVHPLIKHSLDYLIEDRLKQDHSGESLLTLKVADVACGSGHILLAAARRIALQLARARTQEDQPAPAPYRRALREVVQHCIYGVDKNPLAVELCKVALWLEAHNPGQPLNFLDHRIRCGDAIVGVGRAEDLDRGIPDEAFKTLPGDDKEVASRLRKANKEARKGMEAIRKANQAELLQRLSALGADWISLDTLEENTVQAVEAKRRHYEKLRTGAQWWRLRQLADLATAQFFIPKTPENELYLSTEKDFRDYSSGRKALQTQAAAKAVGVGAERRFFHWFLEFPEVFSSPVGGGREGAGGFDCVVGNPPYLGGTRISTFHGNSLLNYIHTNYPNAKDRCDLVAYFLRRSFNIIKGIVSIITTDTISEGDTRIGGLEMLLKDGGDIHFVNKSIKWPGKAKTQVTLLSVSKSNYIPKFLNGKTVKNISSFLDDNMESTPSKPLKQNDGNVFTGTKVYGEGFVLSESEMHSIIQTDEKYRKVIYRYLTGDDIVNNIYQESNRWVINFFDWSKEESQNYPLCFQRIKELVKPVRDNLTTDSFAQENWWLFQRPREELYKSIEKHEKVLVMAQTGKYVIPVFVKNDFIFSVKCIVFKFGSFYDFTILQSSFHVEWAWKNKTSMGGTTIQYSTGNCFDNFCFPQKINESNRILIEEVGRQLHSFRRALLLGIQLALTDTYNLFHAQKLPESEQAGSLAALPPKAIEKQYGKDVAKLVRHLESSEEATYSLEQALAGIHRLRALHVEMDQAVLEAYGWTDIDLRHDFYAVDYLPENDRVRFTIHPEARREVLKRLLELNHQIYGEEVARGLHGKGKKKSASGKKAGGSSDGEQGELF